MQVPRVSKISYLTDYLKSSGKRETTSRQPFFFFLRSYVQSHVFSIVLQCFSMVTRWTIQFEIIQKFGDATKYLKKGEKKKKKGNGHRRVKTRFCGGRNGIVPRGFSIWPPEEVIFKDIRFFLMVINIFLAILFNVFYLFCVDKNLQGLFLQIWPWGWTTSLLVHHNIIEEFHKDRWRKGEIKLGRQKKKW